MSMPPPATAPPKDARGVVVQVGDLVRILGLPDLAGMSPAAQSESRPVFAHLLGTYRRVRTTNELRWLEFAVRIRSGPHAGRHPVWIEPELVRVRRARK